MLNLCWCGACSRHAQVLLPRGDVAQSRTACSGSARARGARLRAQVAQRLLVRAPSGALRRVRVGKGLRAQVAELGALRAALEAALAAARAEADALAAALGCGGLPCHRVYSIPIRLTIWPTLNL